MSLLNIKKTPNPIEGVVFRGQLQLPPQAMPKKPRPRPLLYHQLVTKKSADPTLIPLRPVKPLTKKAA